MNLVLDKKDKKILGVLQENADFTTRLVAKRTQLPVTTIHNRIRRLKKEKIIKRFTVDLDYNKVGKGFLAYILVSVDLQLLKQRKKTQYGVADDLKRLYFVERADIVSGGTDLVVMVRVKDVEEFDQVLLKKLQLIEGIEKTQSLIVIHSK